MACMPMGDDAWDDAGTRFVDSYYGSLRGRVRTHVIHQHLRTHLPPPPWGIVDVGGGAGHQSLPLAREGYDVAIVDPSPAMLTRAAERIAHEAESVAQRVRLIEATGEGAPEALSGERFGAVLCHGVLMYLDDPAPLVAALSTLAAPGAIMSIVTKNAATLAVRPALAGDWSGALAAFEGDREINGLGMDTRGDSIDALSNLLRAHHVDTIAWHGVRLFTDGWTPNDLAADDEDLVLQVELTASQRDPYRQLSRLFHLLGRRR